MTEPVKEFIEYHIKKFDTKPIAQILDDAYCELSNKEVDELVTVFEEAGIECKSHVPDVVRSIVKNSVNLISQKVRVKLLVDYLPTFGLSYNELRSIVIDIVKELYPNKRLQADNMGIEYFVEKT